MLGGLGGIAAIRATKVKQYCNVIGYVAPQNKFDLRLPPMADWNQNFFFSACAGLCGVVDGTACNPGLARGYASVTSNGGHDGIPPSMVYGPPMLQAFRKTSAGAGIMLSPSWRSSSRRATTGGRSNIPTWPAVRAAERRFCGKHRASRKTSTD